VCGKERHLTFEAWIYRVYWSSLALFILSAHPCTSGGHLHRNMYTHTCTHPKLTRGRVHTLSTRPRTAARQILPHTNGFWLLLSNPSILTWVDVLSKIQTLERSHQPFMWHRWRVAIRRQAVSLGDLRCCSVAWGDFEKQYPEMRKKIHTASASLKSVSLSVSLPRIETSFSPWEIYVAIWMYISDNVCMEELFLQCLPNIKTHSVNNACVCLFLPKHIWFLCICLSWNCQDFVKISFSFFDRFWNILILKG
jgi:hypothetical protein